MTLRTGMTALFAVGPPPQGGDVLGLVRWCTRLFEFLQQFVRRPEVSGLTLQRIDAAPAADFKAVDGMVMYAGPGVLGAGGGLYLRDGGTWKLISAA
jgi:hypothetical protein